MASQDKISSSVSQLRICSTLLLSLNLFGYSFFTSTFASLCGNNSSLITTPFRALMLALSCWVIILTIGNNKTQHNNTIFYIFLGIFFIYTLKVIFDLYFDNPLKAGFYYKVMEKYIWFITIPNTLALALSYRYIDYILALKISILLCLFGCIMAFFNMHIYNYQDVGRMAIGNEIQLLNSISLGHFGASSVILCLTQLKKDGFFLKVVHGTLITLGFLIVIKAGSRGPIVSLAFAILMLLLSNTESLLKKVLALLIISLAYCYFEEILHLFSYISPVLENRFYRTIAEGDIERTTLFNLALQEFNKHPFGGGYFMIPYRSYSHNMFVDALMTFGIWGIFFVIFILIISYDAYKIVKSKNQKYQWIGLLFFQLAFANLFSGAFYINMPLITTIIIISSVKFDESAENEANS